MIAECEICRGAQSKYKCPVCLVKYCSVPCYKKHKEVCKTSTSVQPQLPEVSNLNQRANGQPWAPQPERYNFETDNTVKKQKLMLLGYNSEILTCLKNPHLRDLLKHLNSCRNPSSEIAKAMQVPVFYEFASECLKIVDEDNAHLYIHVDEDDEHDLD